MNGAGTAIELLPLPLPAPSGAYDSGGCQRASIQNIK